MSADTRQLSPVRQVQSLIETPSFRANVSKSLPKHLTADRFVRVALMAVTRTPGLAKCTQESLFSCLYQLSAFGLEPDGRRAHLIPYGNACTLIIDYKGLAELAMRSGQVSNLHADKVCENDVFEVDRGEIKKHVIDFRKPRGEAFAFYAICKFKDGTEKSEVMTREDVDKIRKRSRSGGNGPWVTDYDEMAKKTVFRRLSKWLPLSPEFRDAVDADDEGVNVGNGALEVETTRVSGAPVIPERASAQELPLHEEVAEVIANEGDDEKTARARGNLIIEIENVARDTGYEPEQLFNLAIKHKLIPDDAPEWQELVNGIDDGILGQLARAAAEAAAKEPAKKARK